MIKLMKYLKKSAGYIVLIIALLFLQAYCDLSLPDYTSKIINVGIQQKGIEDSVPDKLRDSTLQNLQIFMDEDQKKEVSQNYTQEDDTWLLNDDISKETRENLNEDFSKAMMMVAAFSEDSEQGQAMAAQMGLPEGTDPLTALAQMPEEAVQQIMSQMDEKLKDMPESIVTQAGVSFVASEYEALGKDVDAIQMHYILMSGIRIGNDFHSRLDVSLRIGDVFFAESVAACRSRHQLHDASCAYPRGGLRVKFGFGITLCGKELPIPVDVFGVGLEKFVVARHNAFFQQFDVDGCAACCLVRFKIVVEKASSGVDDTRVLCPGINAVGEPLLRFPHSP